MSEIEYLRIFLVIIMLAHIGTIVTFLLAVKLGVKPKDYGDIC